MRIKIVSLSMLLLSACATPSAPMRPTANVAPIEVMVLGTWHFAGSESDLVSAKTDSVLASRRQQELDEAVRRLAAFKPTVIVTERVTAAPDYVDPKYASFTSADLATNENERVQIAYRLGALTGVTRVYGLDEQPSEGEPDYFPFDRVMAQAAASGRQDKIEELIGDAQTMVAEETKRLSTLTMSEALIEANAGMLSSPRFYYELLKFDAGEQQPGAELNAYWFMRNAKIFSKLIDVTKPGDRVVVVYGAGHKFWLEHLAEQTPGFSRVDPVPFLEADQ